MIAEIIVGSLLGLALGLAANRWIENRRVKRAVARMTLKQLQDHKNKSRSMVLAALESGTLKLTWREKLWKWWRTFTLRGSR